MVKWWRSRKALKEENARLWQKLEEWSDLNVSAAHLPPFQKNLLVYKFANQAGDDELAGCARRYLIKVLGLSI